jgi:hypothetical protein
MKPRGKDFFCLHLRCNFVFLSTLRALGAELTEDSLEAGATVSWVFPTGTPKTMAKRKQVSMRWMGVWQLGPYE